MKNKNNNASGTKAMFETLEDRTCMSAVHPGGVNTVLCDGSVRTVSSTYQAASVNTTGVLIALLLPAVQK